jgi:hypothetical protein
MDGKGSYEFNAPIKLSGALLMSIQDKPGSNLAGTRTILIKVLRGFL